MKKRILLKLTGEAFLAKDGMNLSADILRSLITQIKTLKNSHLFGIVVGGGNFFRGSKEGVHLGMIPSSAHQVGILATVLNGIILKDLLEQQDIETTVFCAIDCPTAGTPISHEKIIASLNNGDTLVFTGGTGNPFFTTDTNAVLRGLQIDADEIWKGTNIDGIYDKDPKKYPDAKFLSQVTYRFALNNHLGIMDPSAFALAEQYKQTIRVFNIFEEHVLIKASNDRTFGSILTV